MRALIRRRRSQRRRDTTVGDPAPSRLAYRLTRIWLSPRLRRLLTVVLPLALGAGALAVWLLQPPQRARVAETASALRAAVEARPEFQIRQLAVTGADPLLDRAIRARVALDFPVSWFDLRKDAIAAEVAALDAVADVAVTLELGGALHLAITQRTPAVLWRRGGTLEVLDATGHRIGFLDRRDGRADLPLITGPGAAAAVPEALALVKAAAPLHTRLIALTRQGARRWDVVLDRDQRILLPAHGAQRALERALVMDAAEELLERDIRAVDLRDPGRPTLRLGPDAVRYRDATRAFLQEMSSR